MPVLNKSHTRQPQDSKKGKASFHGAGPTGEQVGTGKGIFTDKGPDKEGEVVP